MQTTFFVEYPPDQYAIEGRGLKLLELVQQKYPLGEKPLAGYMKQKGYKISLAMSSLDYPSAVATRYFIESGVPVTAWITLPWSVGYWSNLSTLSETIRQVEKVLTWASKHEIKFERIAFDSEKPVQLVQALSRGQLSSAKQQYRGYKSRIESAEIFEKYVVEQLRPSFNLESYVFPKATNQMGGQMPLVGRKVEMLYSSLFPPMPAWLRLMILKLMSDKNAIPAFGIVSGVQGQTPGVHLTESLPRHLSIKELAADFQLAKQRQCEEIFIFALNGVNSILQTEVAMKMAGL